LAQGKVDYSLGTEYRRQQGLAGTGNSLGFFFSSNLPVFNRNQGEIQRARQERAQADARIRALQATIENEVETAYLQYRTARESLNRVEQTMLTKATDVRQITERAYRRGGATFLDFLDAQKAYIDTVQLRNTALADFAKSLYTIDAATGISLAGVTHP
jgi:cobalt-zinc-cadmium efflux system outer membrane protein